MITSLRIQNFKSLEDTGLLPVQPLTFLVGPNSSGKSSVLQCLLMLKQTAISFDITTPLVATGYYTPNVGPYPDFIFGHDIEKLLTISLGFQPPLRPPKLFLRQLQLTELPEINFTASFGCKRRAQIYLQNAEFELTPYKIVLSKLSKTGAGNYEVRFLKDGAGGTPLKGIRPRKFYGIGIYPFRRRIQAPYVNLESIFSHEIEFLFEDRLYYIGPLREWPRRVYPAAGETPKDVGVRGEKAIDLLWMEKQQKKRELINTVEHWLREFGFAAKAKVKKVMENYYQMLVEPVPKLEVNLADIGFGASQLLPIIVEGFHAPHGSTLLIEQPEIHLHPKAQALLGDLFVDITKEKKSLIVETHSEYLLSRVRRLIAEGRIKREDVAIYFFTLKEERTHIQEIQLNELGQFEFEQWPEDFFAEDLKEAAAHFEAMTKAKISQIITSNG